MIKLVSKYRRQIFTSCVLVLWFSILSRINDCFQSTHEDVGNELHDDTLVNLYNFKFVLNNAAICKQNASNHTHSSLVIMIHSARDHFSERYAIRRTWGSLKTYMNWNLHLIFLLGIDSKSHPGNHVENRIMEESNEHKDIIMGNFEDTYHNLTYKHLMGYKWVSTFCSNAEIILKTDDDMFADTFQIVEIVLEEFRNANKSFVCVDMHGNKPIREVDNKWYVSEETFPDESYPSFCSGVAYLMRAADAAKIYSVSNKTKFFWIDDVFVTGILREKYDVLLHNRDEVSLEIWPNIYGYFWGETETIIDWCSKDLGINQLSYAFIPIPRENFIRDSFCIWNKIRLMRYAMHTVVDFKMK
ncbi:Beta-1,3-galactosyltransferase 1 [Pseudolycoriella hygida]|uniref:Hexosyltransferase n=1 Tax=Pseudolycoriella hygida TaxID=35572 RepID=A0A9Q0N5A8_9DIPT|nr:Beta-1,3-galactosyltransferase 1 [Pseudolycoriella hygida]